MLNLGYLYESCSEYSNNLETAIIITFLWNPQTRDCLFAADGSVIIRFYAASFKKAVQRKMMLYGRLRSFKVIQGIILFIIVIPKDCKTLQAILQAKVLISLQHFIVISEIT